MKDRFKFRIWHLNDNSMNNLGTISFKDGQVGYVDYDGDFDRWDNVVIMQCTGLKDNKEKLIYEGDIIKDYLNDKREVRYIQDQCTYFLKDINESELEFVNDNVNTYCECQATLTSGISDGYEIIGNIYENPELLKSDDE